MIKKAPPMDSGEIIYQNYYRNEIVIVTVYKHKETEEYFGGTSVRVYNKNCDF